MRMTRQEPWPNGSWRWSTNSIPKRSSCWPAARSGWKTEQPRSELDGVVLFPVALFQPPDEGRHEIARANQAILADVCERTEARTPRRRRHGAIQRVGGGADAAVQQGVAPGNAAAPEHEE